MQDAWGCCTGMTQRDGMEREVGGRFRIGNKVRVPESLLTLNIVLKVLASAIRQDKESKSYR